MNNKEFIAALSQKVGLTTSETQNAVRTSVNSIIEMLCDDKSVTLSGLGSFDVKKRLERVIVNPSSGQKMLVPPKLVVNFKPMASLKEKVK
ncbi:MAG: HU family DNA-binding protein [Prevotella sp.]|nr:HU family DNA-binding protein [Prevotella sp.]MBR4651335.1 HU family DNA-binding protein [Prevotella sp.]